MSKIEWTEKTWNPIVGCSVVSPGCTNCYAMKMASRLEAMAGDGLDDNGYAVRGIHPLSHYRGTTRLVKGNPVWTGKLTLAPEHILAEPLRRKKPTMWFVNSMSDLFHESVPAEWIDRVFAVMAMCPQHTFQVLTKRSAHMRDYLSAGERGAIVHSEKIRLTGRFDIRPSAWPLRNVWLGVSCEDQKRADERVPHLLATPAAVRFVSAEPLIGPIDFEQAWCGENALDGECWGECGWCKNGHPPLHNCQLGKGDWERGRSGLDWVIVGGESGPGARPMHPDWARSIRDQCKAAGVPFFFKQWGNWLVGEEKQDGAQGTYVAFQDGDEFHVVSDGHDIVLGAAQDEAAGPKRIWGRFGGWRGNLIKHAGKKDAGRMLDARTWDEMPACSGRVAV